MRLRSVLIGFCMFLFPVYSAEKWLVEFGWDEPDTTFLREHIAEMQKTPFDGCVFHANYRDSTGKTGNFTWEAWGERSFRPEELEGALQDLKRTQFTRFSRNFLRFNTTPARLDWFDDYSAVLANARLAALIARNGKCKGLLFDIEQYEGALFDFRKQRDRETKSWELYAAQARKRGREVMQAFQREFPNITLFLTFGYSLPWSESRQGKLSLAECHYGLLAPFLDGMLEAAEPSVRFIDGCELSYGYKERSRFDREYQAMRQDLLPIVADPAKYRQHFSLGFGLWLDHDWRKNGWNLTDLEKNYFSPQRFEASVRSAFAVSDEYVWIYTETPRWWSTSGTAEKLPQEYVEAIRRARP